MSNLFKRVVPYLRFNQFLQTRLVSKEFNELVKSRIVLIPKNRKELHFMVCIFDFVKYDLTKINSLQDNDFYLLSGCRFVKFNSDKFITTTGINHLCNCKTIIFNGQRLFRKLNCSYISAGYTEVELSNSFVCNQVINLGNATIVTIKNCVFINVKLINSSLYSLRIFNSCLEMNFLQNIFYVDFYSLKSTFNT